MKLVVAGNVRRIRHFTVKYGHGVDDAIFWGERRLCGVKVSELDGVRELMTIFILFDYGKGVLVVDSGSNFKTVLAT